MNILHNPYTPHFGIVDALCLPLLIFVIGTISSDFVRSKEACYPVNIVCMYVLSAEPQSVLDPGYDHINCR